MEEPVKKIDGRKMNGGRGVKKENNPKLKHLYQNNTQQDQVEQKQNTMVTENNNTTPENTNADQVTETTNNVTDTENKYAAAENVQIIDESKLSDEIPAADKQFTPVQEPVVQEEYRNPYKGQVPENVVAPEAKYEKPDINAMKNAMFSKSEEKTNSDSSNTTSNTTQQQPVSNGTNDTLRKTLENPDLKYASSDEKRQGAEQLVDGALGLYAKINELGAWAASINIEKKKEEQLDGKIDLGFQIPIDAETVITLEEFIVNYNNECKKAISVSPEFIEKVKPVMIRICEKNGWGLTDEQYLIYMFGRDILEKTAMIVGMKRSMNASLRMISKIHLAQKEERENAGTTKQNNDTAHDNTYQHNHYREQATHQDFVNHKQNTESTDIIVPEVVGEENQEQELSSLKINDNKENPDLDINKQ